MMLHDIYKDKGMEKNLETENEFHTWNKNWKWLTNTEWDLIHATNEGGREWSKSCGMLRSTDWHLVTKFLNTSTASNYGSSSPYRW
jgi:hypothetical protein